MGTRMKAPFKRGTLLVWTNRRCPQPHEVDVKYVKWWGFARSALIVVERLDTKERFTAHINEVRVKDQH